MHVHVPVVNSSHPAYADACICGLEDQELTIEKAVSIALANNRRLKAIYDRLGIAQAALMQAGLLPNPIFSFAYQFANQGGISALINFGLMQNVLDTFLIPLKKRMAGYELEITKQMLASAVLQMVGEVQIAYYTLQARTEILALSHLLLDTADAAYTAAQHLSAAGNLRDLDVSIQRLEYEQAQVAVAEAELAVLDARENLNTLMGLWGCQIHWSYPCMLPALPAVECQEVGMENVAIANSLDLAIAKNILIATASGLRMDIIRQVFPQIEAGPAFEREEGIWYIGPAFAVAIPCFDFGQARTLAAQAEILRQWDEMTALAIEIRSMTRRLQLHVDNVFQQSLYYNEYIVPDAEQITAETLLQTNAMQIGVISLLMAKKSEIQKKLAAVELQKEYWIARTRLDVLYNGHLIP